MGNQGQQHQHAWQPASIGGGNRHAPSSSGDIDVALRSFLDRYPIDERATDYLNMQQPHIIEQVLNSFRPKKEGDSDYSAIVMSFTKRCRDQGGSREASGAPWKRQRT